MMQAAQFIFKPRSIWWTEPSPAKALGLLGCSGTSTQARFQHSRSSRLLLFLNLTPHVFRGGWNWGWWICLKDFVTEGKRFHNKNQLEARMSLAPADCTPKCRSQQHADQVIAALTGGSERQLKAFLTSYCHNATTLRDAFGRTALHLAASLGKKAVLEWLLESKGADLMVKDKESGWTALHRSAFYGQIHCLTSLIKVQFI